MNKKKVVSILLGALIILGFPLLLIYGVKFLGVSEISFGLRSYIGSVLITIYILALTRINQKPKNESN